PSRCTRPPTDWCAKGMSPVPSPAARPTPFTNGHSEQRLPPCQRPTRGLEVVAVDDLSVASVPEVFEDGRGDRVGDAVYRPVGEDGVGAAGVRRAEKIFPAIIVSVVVGPRRVVGGPDDIVLPAGGVADVIVTLGLAQVPPVQALLGYHQGV